MLQSSLNKIDKKQITSILSEGVNEMAKEFELDLTEEVVLELYSLLGECNWTEIKKRKDWQDVIRVMSTQRDYFVLFSKLSIIISIFLSCRYETDLYQESTKDYTQYVANVIKLTREIKDHYCMFIEEFASLGDNDDTTSLEKLIEDLSLLVKEYVVHVGNINSYHSKTSKPSLTRACLLASSYTAADSIKDVASVLNTTMVIGTSFSVSIALGASLPLNIAVAAGTNIFSFISNKLFGHTQSSLFSVTVAAASVGSSVIGSYDKYRPTIFGVIDSVLSQLPLKLQIPSHIKPWLESAPSTLLKSAYDNSSITGKILNSAQSMIQGGIDYLTGNAANIAKNAQLLEYNKAFSATSDYLVKPISTNVYIIGILLILYIFVIFRRFGQHYSVQKVKSMSYQIEERYRKQTKLLDKLPMYDNLLPVKKRQKDVKDKMTRDQEAKRLKD